MQHLKLMMMVKNRYIVAWHMGAGDGGGRVGGDNIIIILPLNGDTSNSNRI